jgi:ribose transport system ATP-binding protein
VSNAPPLLEISNVAKRFGSVVALRSATMSVRAGEIHALMGANGAGKSTLVKIITGVFTADAGTIAVNGAARSFRSPKEARLAGIVSVYQDPALVPDLTILDNMRLAQVPVSEVRRWTGTLGLGDLQFSAFVRDLPYPVLRLIDLARALASDPQILMLDEITAALPSDLAERVFKVMRQWRERGRSIIFISHRMAEVAAHCDRATVLRDGIVVGVTEAASGREDEIVALMLGRAVEAAQAAARDEKIAATAGRQGAPALEVRDLCGRMLDRISFRLRPGEILGVAALEGQGQDELFACIAGAASPASGEIAVQGKALRLRHPADAIAEGIVLVPANRLQALLQQRSIRENVALPSYRRFANWGLIGMRGERERVSAAVRRLEIDTRAESQVRQLSGGNQQKVVIARWVASGFKVLLWFDATRGIDIGTKHQIYRLIREFADAGSAVLLFSSELPEIPLSCDRVIVLFGGRIVDEMPAGAADEATLLRAAHGLSSRAAQSA